jgi:hypothetical protein
MNFNKMKVIPVTVLLILFMLVIPVSAEVEITNFFSDFTSTDITFNSTNDFQGKAVFELFYEGNLVESHEIPVEAKAGKSISKVVIWEEKPQYDYYTAKVGLFDDRRLLASSSYQVSYGTVALPAFHVADFSPTNRGVQLLLTPFNPSAADIEIELIDNSDIVYTKTTEDVSLVQNTEIEMLWPFMLTNNKKYTVRAKIFTHRLYAPPLTNTYIAYFTAGDDVEILPDDVQVDEYGASVTLRGKSQVPFDGSIVVSARNRVTNETHIFRTQVEEILVLGKEDTAGVVWKGLAPGTYDVEILAVNQENTTIDKYQTAVRIPEYSNVSKEVSAKSTPGFEVVLLMLTLLAAAWRGRYV